MFTTSAFRMSRMAAPVARRALSTATVSASKSNYARNAMMATAGLAAAFAVIQEREVRLNNMESISVWCLNAMNSHNLSFQPIF